MTSKLVQIIIKHEGVVPHLYLDHLGNVTCGVGFLCRSPKDVLLHAWTDTARALEDFKGLQAMADAQRASPKSAVFFEKLTGARMLRPSEGVSGVLLRNEIAMRKGGFPTHQLPDDVSYVVHDMAYQLGVGGLLKGFPKFVQAVKEGRFNDAASECEVRDGGRARNAWRVATLRAAYN